MNYQTAFVWRCQFYIIKQYKKSQMIRYFLLYDIDICIESNNDNNNNNNNNNNNLYLKRVTQSNVKDLP